MARGRITVLSPLVAANAFILHWAGTFAHGRYATVGQHMFLLRNPPFREGSAPPSNTWFLGHTQVSRPNDISISSAVFAQLSYMPSTDRQTDRPHCVTSVAIGLVCGLHAGDVA